MSEQMPEAQRVRIEQREFWNNAAPGWKRMWVGLERAAQHVSDRLVELARIKPGDRVLDIATGSGEPGITAARKVGPAGLVIATDQSPAMLALARERAAALGLKNIRFVETDAESLTVEETAFDAVLCRWGLMFIPDLDNVARMIARRLKQGGYFATAVWSAAERVPMITAGDDAIRALANLPPLPTDAPHPCRLADTKPLEQALARAGLRDIHVESVIVRREFESAEAFTEERKNVSSPLRALLSKQSPELQRQILDAMTQAARKYANASGKIHMDNEAICIAAHL